MRIREQLVTSFGRECSWKFRLFHFGIRERADDPTAPDTLEGPYCGWS